MPSNLSKIRPGYAYATDGPIVVMTGYGGALEIYKALEKEGMSDFIIGDAILIYLSGHYRLNQLRFPNPEEQPNRIELDGPPVTSENSGPSPVMDQFMSEFANDAIARLTPMLGHKKAPPKTDEA